MSIKRHTAYNLAGAIVPIVVSLVTVPVYLHLVGAERYGVLAIAWLLLGYFGLFDLGLGTATAQGIAAARDGGRAERASLFWNAAAINAVMGLVGAAALYAAGAFFFGAVFKVGPGLRAELLAALPLIAAIVPVATLGGVLTGALQGRERFAALNILGVGFGLLSQLAPLAVAWIFGPNLSLLIGASLATRAMSLAAMAWLCRVELTRGEPMGLAWSRMASLLRFGGWVTVSAFVGPVMTILDRFVIGALSGPAAVAVYTIPFQLAQRVLFLPVALTSALFPRLSASSPEEEARLGRAGMLSILCVLTAPIVFGIFALEPFLRLWIGAELYAPAAEVGRILLFGFWANGLAQVPFSQLQARGRPRLNACVHLAELPVYLLAFYLLTVRFGIAGAAMAFALRCYADFLVFTALALRGRAPRRAIVASSALVAGAVLAAGSLPSFSAPWLGALATLLAATGVLVFLFAPTELTGMARRLVERLPGRRGRAGVRPA